MRTTDFDDLLDTKADVSTSSGSGAWRVQGAPVGPADLQALGLEEYTYRQVTQGVEANVTKAGERATLHIGTIFARLNQVLDLSHNVHRAIVVAWTVYELYMATGNEKAGREWRIKAKDLIVALCGAYPEAATPDDARPVVGALSVPRPRRYAPYDSRRC